MKNTAASLLTDIEAFLERHHLSATRFGVLAAGDTKLVKTLREGRKLRKSTEARIREWMDAQETTGET